MPDGEEEPLHVEALLTLALGALDGDRLEEVRPGCLLELMVPDDLDLRVVEGPLLHDLRSAELVAAMDEVDLLAVFGEERRLLDRRVAAADHRQVLLAEHGQRAIADRASADAAHPELTVVGAGYVEPLRGRARREDDALRLPALRVRLVLEGVRGEVDRIDGLGDDGGPEALGLLAHRIHELGAHDPFGETGEVLHIRGGRELSAGGDTRGHEALEHHGLELGASGVDGSGMGGGAGPDDEDVVDHR